MSCPRPKKIVNPRYRGLDAESLHRLSERLYGVGFPPNYWISIPCGNCLDCQKRKFRDYRMRLLYELKQYPNSIFVTLTFDNPSLSRFRDNPNSSIRLFLDRIRKKYGHQVRHWFVAEFGKKRGRLHYHGILFNIDIGNTELSKLWKYGNTFVGYANEATAKYIVKYLTKQDTKGIAPPRVITSKGIGSSWLSSPECNILRRSLSTTIYHGGRPFQIPRYYIDKMFTEREKEIISYYYHMETPPQTEFFINGRSYDLKNYEYHRQQKLKSYRQNGFLFDDYLRQRSLCSATRFRIACEVASKYTEFNI